MRSIVLRFYRREECLGEDGGLDYRRMGKLEPLDSIRARPEVVLRTHLRHLGFQIARYRPDLEGETLPVELQFHGQDGQPKAPVLVALHEGRPVARRRVHLATLNTAPFLAVLLRRKPLLEGADLVFTVDQAGDGDEP